MAAITVNTDEKDLRRRFANDPNVYVSKRNGKFFLCAKPRYRNSNLTNYNTDDMVPVPGLSIVLMHPKDIEKLLSQGYCPPDQQ